MFRISIVSGRPYISLLQVQAEKIVRLQNQIGILIYSKSTQEEAKRALEVLVPSRATKVTR